jgi:hypothetical protein
MAIARAFPCRKNYLSPDLEVSEMSTPPLVKSKNISDNYFASQRGDLDWR